MNKIPVLLLISKNIGLRILNNSPRFSSYRFFSLSAIQYLEDPTSKLTGLRLQNVLNQKINLIKPQYLIAHLGLAFERYPVEFLNAVLVVKAACPEIKIGMDRSLEYVIQHLQVFYDANCEPTSVLRRVLSVW